MESPLGTKSRLSQRRGRNCLKNPPGTGTGADPETVYFFLLLSVIFPGLKLSLANENQVVTGGSKQISRRGQKLNRVEHAGGRSCDS